MQVDMPKMTVRRTFLLPDSSDLPVMNFLRGNIRSNFGIIFKTGDRKPLCPVMKAKILKTKGTAKKKSSW